MHLLIVIPCLNEEKYIDKVIDSIPKKFAGVEQFEILVVDDGSVDKTAVIAQGSGAKVLSHATNFGVGRAFKSGLEYAIKHKFDIMVNIDGDGQFDPSDIHKLIDPIIQGNADFVTASRFLNKAEIKNMPRIKLWGNKQITKLVSRLSGVEFTDVSCGFRAYSRETMLKLNLQGTFTYTQESFLNLAFKNLKIIEVPITVKYFPERRSRVADSIPKYAMNTSIILFRTYRDYRPLRFFWSIALAWFLLSLNFGTFFLTWRITYGHFSPHIWSGFTAATFLFLGLIFFIMGVVADMMDRIRNNQEEILYFLRKNSK